MKIALASDHAGFALKEAIKPFVAKLAEVIDFGTHSEVSMDYPDTGFAAAKAVKNGECDYGILICGSGIGMSIVANKVPHIRAALCHCTDFARLARQHNNANIICLPGKFIAPCLAEDMIRIFLTTEFEGGRHENRINKIKIYEENHS
ncbi:MAG TPA: ribose 5-phosphate isomerase B [Candidatus Cloacimonadota bacterium]|nr:ribose 5-phosphate isomerase B [Candidatus Cloacimonadota bacterium]HPT71401.1 ribose 5-phosphate isomerase B [Candidatus Cloacimonadota bacterium]